MSSKLKIIGASVVGVLTSALGILKAGAQTVPTWDTTSTGIVVEAAADSFKDTFVYVLQVIAPYAIIVTLVVGTVWFFVRLARKH